MNRLELLKQLKFGTQVAEEEVADLASYFVETDLWNRIISGDIDIIRGEKGTGKSAIYLLLEANLDALFDRGVFLVSAENPRGTTVFKDLIPDPPVSEQEFVTLWKIYLAVIIAHKLRGFGLRDHGLNELYAILEEVGLLEPELNLSGVLRTAQNFARRLLRSRVEAGMELDDVSGAPSGIIGRISLGEPTGELRSRGITSIDGLFATLNAALAANRYQVWALLDRLDVAFADNHKLEANALRALIRVYSDFRAYDNIVLKIFIREDIWNRITADGFREASHIVRYESVHWTTQTLLNLLMKRILNNEILCQEMGVNKAAVLDDMDKQNEVFGRLFPDKVESGPKNPTTFNLNG